MPRSLDPVLASALTGKQLCPLFLVDLTINSQVLHITSAPGNFTWNGNAYIGIGDLGQIRPAKEGVDIQAAGAQLILSGVDPNLIDDSLTDIQLGAPATIWLAVIDPETIQLIGSPVVMFAGLVDAPTVSLSVQNGDDGTPATATITVPLESKLALLGSGQQRRYSRADQNLTYPDDTAFNWVSLLNYLALRWQP